MRLFLFLFIPFILCAETMDFSEPQFKSSSKPSHFSTLRKTVCDDGWVFYWSKKEGHFYKERTGTLLTVYENNGPKTWEENGFTYSSESSGKMLSIVGNTISIQIEWYSDDGAHPSYGKGFRTYNIVTGSKASLLDFFSEEQVFNALMGDGVVKKMLGGKSVNSLTELFEKADGGCKYYFGEHVLNNFAFHHINGNRVAIRIGLSHGCEVEHGRFGQLGLYLPLSATLKREVIEADREKRLMGTINK